MSAYTSEPHPLVFYVRNTPVRIDLLWAEVKQLGTVFPHRSGTPKLFNLDGSPASLIGLALHDQGVCLADVAGVDNYNYRYIRDLIHDGRVPGRESLVDTDYADYLAQVESNEDHGMPWGRAVAGGQFVEQIRKGVDG